jgi:hypothetical protein
MPKSSEPRVKRVITYAEHQGNLVKCGIKSLHDNNTDHVGSLEYASTFGGSDSIHLIVEVDPKDVVAVPHDCNFQKLRTCRYKVVARYVGPLPAGHVNAYTDTEVEQELDTDDEDEFFNIRDEEIEMAEEALAEAQDQVADAAEALLELSTAAEDLAKATAALEAAKAELDELKNG